MAPRMRGSTTRAGGCFLTVFILAGLPFGLAIGNPMNQCPARFHNIGRRVSPSPRNTPVPTVCNPSNS